MSGGTRGSSSAGQCSPGRRGDGAAEREEEDGVAGALQERSRSVYPEGSNAGRYYVLRH